jgi:hypothetical protein
MLGCYEQHDNERSGFMKGEELLPVYHRSAFFRRGSTCVLSLVYWQLGGSRRTHSDHRYKPANDSQAQLISLRHHVLRGWPPALFDGIIYY